MFTRCCSHASPIALLFISSCKKLPVFGQLSEKFNTTSLSLSRSSRSSQASPTPSPSISDCKGFEIDSQLSQRWSLTAGLRVERFDADYDDSLGVTAAPGETLWGGELVLDYQLTDTTFFYGLLSRGYKVGGVNGEALGKAVKNDFDPGVVAFLDQRLEFDSETLINWELGWKARYFQDSLAVRLALFYMDQA